MGESAAEGSSDIPILEEEGEGEDEVDSYEIFSRHELETHTATGSAIAILDKYIYEDHESSGSDNENDDSTPGAMDVVYEDEQAAEAGIMEPEPEGIEPPKWEIFLPKDVATTKGRVENVKIDDVPPSSRTHGTSRNIPPECKTPLQFFLLFFDDEVMEKFVSCTNKYARKKDSNWIDTDASQLLALFAVLMYMGLVHQPTMRSYWTMKDEFQRDMFNRVIVSEAFTRDRFERLLSSLHYIDVSEMDEEQREREKARDGFYLLAPFFEDLSRRFSMYFQCGQYIDVDEMCIGFKGRHIFCFYNPNKPHKWLFKAFCLNDSCGYLHRFYMYRGTKDHEGSDYSASSFPIYVLTEDAEYHGVNHTLCIDNWFTSIPVMYLCIDRKIHCVGTCRSNRAGIPKDKILRTKPTSDTMGEVAVVEAVYKKAKLYFSSWRDKNNVYFLATYPPRIDHVPRMIKQKDGTT